MAENEKVSITIDQRKYRVRIHKTTLHLIGDPKYIQLLVNTEQKKLAIRGLMKEDPTAQCDKVNYNFDTTDHSFELYSSILIGKLCNVIQCEDRNCSFRLYGIVIPAQSLALFSFDTVEIIDGKD